MATVRRLAAKRHNPPRRVGSEAAQSAPQVLTCYRRTESTCSFISFMVPPSGLPRPFVFCWRVLVPPPHKSTENGPAKSPPKKQIDPAKHRPKRNGPTNNRPRKKTAPQKRPLTNRPRKKRPRKTGPAKKRPWVNRPLQKFMDQI